MVPAPTCGARTPACRPLVRLPLPAAGGQPLPLPSSPPPLRGAPHPSSPDAATWLPRSSLMPHLLPAGCRTRGAPPALEAPPLSGCAVNACCFASHPAACLQCSRPFVLPNQPRQREALLRKQRHRRPRPHAPPLRPQLPAASPAFFSGPLLVQPSGHTAIPFTSRSSPSSCTPPRSLS